MTSTSSYSRLVVWTVWIIASVFYAYQYVLRVMPNIMLTDIMQQFQIDAATFGQFSGVYYIGYSLMHIPLGIMLDRFGPRVVMTACIILTVSGLLPLMFAHHWFYPILGRFLMGLGSSAAILGAFKIIRMMFKEERFPRMLSFSVTIGLVGAIYGGAPVHYMRDTFGYQTVIQIFALAGVALAVVTYWIVPNITSGVQSTVFSDIKEVLSNRRVIGSCLCAGLMVGPLEGFADVWGTAFLKQVYGLDSTVAASLPSMIFIGMCFGAPVLSWIAEKIGSYLLTIVSSGVTMALVFFALLPWSISPGVLSALFVLVGVCCAYQILAIYSASTYVREGVAGLTTAIANMIIMTFGYVFHTVIGSVVSSCGGPQVSTALLYGVVVIPIALCIGFSGFIKLFFEERKSKKLEKTAVRA
jgi:predicted MFS family arabinose efflux permease